MQYAKSSTEDQLAVVLSPPNEIDQQFKGSPVIEKGTGFVQAASINTILATLRLLPCIGGMVMDTRAWNTGVIKGAASKLEKILKHPVLWIGCRHHTCELHIKHAYIACHGDVFTKGKDSQLFKRLHTEWIAHFGDWIRGSDGKRRTHAGCGLTM